MQRFKLEQSEDEIYSSHGGLALIGVALNRYTDLPNLASGIGKVNKISTMDVVRAFVGNLALGKSDFDAIDNVREDVFFKQAMGIKHIPSAARARQRMDEHASELLPAIDQGMVNFLQRANAPISALACGHVALDIDAFPMDNSNTRKQGVSRTYKGHDGYAPTGSYLGTQGWCIGMELREGDWHSNREFSYLLDRVLGRARALIGEQPLLVRLDGGYDARANLMQMQQTGGCDYVVRWNPRQFNTEALLEQIQAVVADPASDPALKITCDEPRAGKQVYLFSQMIQIGKDAQAEPIESRRVMRLSVRSIDKRGQVLLTPELQIEGWWTSLAQSGYEDQQIIALYQDHATSEQFHSEIKSDLDLERLPSGKFDTNDLVLTLGGLVYNILRWIGQGGLIGPDAPVRHKGFATKKYLYEPTLEWVAPSDPTRKNINPDLMIQRADEYYDIIDLKTGELFTKSLTVGKTERKKLCSKALEGVAQLANYREYFTHAENAAFARAKHGIVVNKPNLYLVIGTLDNLDDERLMEACRMFLAEDFTVMNYDTLVARILA